MFSHKNFLHKEFFFLIVFFLQSLIYAAKYECFTVDLSDGKNFPP